MTKVQNEPMRKNLDTEAGTHENVKKKLVVANIPAKTTNPNEKSRFFLLRASSLFGTDANGSVKLELAFSIL